MKRLIIFIMLLGLMVCNMSFSQDSAAVLIDFTELEKNVTLEDGAEENRETLIYFGEEAGVGITEEIRNKMFTSLAMDNWRVTLSSSSRTVERQSLCKAMDVYTLKKNDAGEREQDQAVLGVRVRFPQGNYNSYALIRPPYELQAYQKKHIDDGSDTITKENLKEDETDIYGTKFLNRGVLKNVGIIKTISAEVYGANFPYGLGIILMDENYEERIYQLGYLNYEGWQTIQWENPSYIDDVRARELKTYPLYPRSTPYIKLIGFVITRDAATEGGDFISYFKNVKITYDDAVMEKEDIEIDHESVWGIIRDRNQSRRKVEYKRLGNRLLLEVLERQKTVEHKEAIEGDQ